MTPALSPCIIIIFVYIANLFQLARARPRTSFIYPFLLRVYSLSILYRRHLAGRLAINPWPLLSAAATPRSYIYIPSRGNFLMCTTGESIFGV